MTTDVLTAKAFNIRALTTVSDFAAAVSLQESVWGLAAHEVPFPVSALEDCASSGGIIIGAWSRCFTLAGVAMATTVQGRAHSLHSCLMGVNPPFRRYGVAYALKQEQRRLAQLAGATRITWTFDPLMAVNAHLNVRRLGATASRYLENVYGASCSHLHRGSPTDRLVADWDLESPNTMVADQEVKLAAVINTIQCRRGVPEPSACDLTLDAPVLVVRIPTSWQMLGANYDAVKFSWRLATRAVFTHYFARGYIVTDFLLREACGEYVLSKSSIHGLPQGVP